MPKFFSQAIAEIVRLLHIDLYIANREIVAFPANGIGVRLRLPVLVSVSFLVKPSGLLYAFDRIPREERTCLFLFQNKEKGVYIFFRKFS